MKTRNLNDKPMSAAEFADVIAQASALFDAARRGDTEAEAYIESYSGARALTHADWRALRYPIGSRRHANRGDELRALGLTCWHHGRMHWTDLGRALRGCV